MDTPLLKLVKSGPRKRKKLPHGLLECSVCLEDTGTSGTTWLEVKRMPMVNKSRRLVGGQKSHVCVDCLARGKVTHITD